MTLRALSCRALTFYALTGLVLLAPDARARDAASPIVSSPISGIVFNDAPRILPVDSRFSQAVQTIGFDLGLSCSQIESYGWTLAPTEQNRVNGIFADAAQELARLGYVVQPQNPGSAAADLTVYTATRPDRTVLFTWSAGANGLLLLLCDARTDVVSQGFGPAPGTIHKASAAAPGESAMPAPLNPQDLVGDWQGTYSCMSQGPAGGTLTISRVQSDAGHSPGSTAISGSFSFYPLDDKNPELPRGSYRVAGRLDTDSGRALLDPGAWLQRPPGFTYAPLIVEFTPAEQRVSAVFQGTTGCTSFEGNYKPGSALLAAAKAAQAEAIVERPVYEDRMPARKAKVAPRKSVRKTAAPKTATVQPAAPVAEAMPVVVTPTATPADTAPVVVPETAPDVTVPVVPATPATAPTPVPAAVAPALAPTPTVQPVAASVAIDKVDEKKPLTVEPIPAGAKPAVPAPVAAAPITPPITVPPAPPAPVQ